MAWSKWVNDRGHFWMVRQVLHDFTFVSNLFHYIGNPSRVKKSVSVVGGGGGGKS